jgi:DNA-binding SARP family transcriptional activator
MLELQCFGTIKLRRGDQELPTPPRAARLLLTLLVAQRGRALSRAEVQAQLWPEADQ